jgi:transcriptional regulator of arginine metabolism
MNKKLRQARILRLIASRAIHTQEELARELARVGVKTTQVTLSRDIHDLGLVKTPHGYRQITPPAAGPPLATVAAEFLVDVTMAQNLVVLRTTPGNANSLAVALDREEWPDVAGTIAGDDTVLVIAPDKSAATRTRGRLLKFLGGG